MILLERTVEIWNIILAYSWRQPNRNFYISPETSPVPINLTLRNSFLIMHLIIFIHLTALYLPVAKCIKCAQQKCRSSPLFHPFPVFPFDLHFSLNQDPCFCGKSQSDESTFALHLLLQFRQGLIPGSKPQKNQVFRRNCILCVGCNMSKSVASYTYSGSSCISGYVYGIIWDMVDKYEWTFNPRALVHDVWSVWLQDQNIIRKPSRFNQSLNDHI